MTVPEKIAAIRDLMQNNRIQGLMEAGYYAYGSAVGGDIVEFGTMTGDTARAMGLSMLAVEGQYSLPPKRIYLFDSFEGLPDPERTPDLESPHVVLGHWSRGGCVGLSRSQLELEMSLILPEDRYSLVEGWYSQTVPLIPSDQRFAMVHVDSDLYSSAIDALVPLFQRGQVSRGAVICFDDWMCNQADPAYSERKAFSEVVQQFGIEFSPWGAYTWSGSRFIIHSYIGMTDDS
jgi:hypothetical protein